jgi:hypothetical protein
VEFLALSFLLLFFFLFLVVFTPPEPVKIKIKPTIKIKELVKQILCCMRYNLVRIITLTNLKQQSILEHMKILGLKKDLR